MTPPAPSVPSVPVITLVHGDEEFLYSRALRAVESAVRSIDPTVEVQSFQGSTLELAAFTQALSPALFGGSRLVVLASAQDLPTAHAARVLSLLSDVDEGTYVAVQHVGGAKGKGLVESVRGVGAVEIACWKLTRAEDRLLFVRDEVVRCGSRITAGAAAALVDAVGTDLRELAAAAAQLVGDTDTAQSGGLLDENAVAAYHRGHAEMSGFAVADEAVLGNLDRALSNLRWALNNAVPYVLIADALADGVRTVARVSAAGRGEPFRLAQTLGLPPWKIKRARTQAVGWSVDGLSRALQVVAGLNADVKGAAADAPYALESAIRLVVTAKAALR